MGRSYTIRCHWTDNQLLDTQKLEIMNKLNVLQDSGIYITTYVDRYLLLVRFLCLIPVCGVLFHTIVDGRTCKVNGATPMEPKHAIAIKKSNISNERHDNVRRQLYCQYCQRNTFLNFNVHAFQFIHVPDHFFHYLLKFYFHARIHILLAYEFLV